MHTPVLLEEVLDFFSYPMNVFIDGTLGFGGHAEALIKAHPEIEMYYGFDKDPEALAYAQKRLPEKLIPIHDSFSNLEGLGVADGILLDLGVSSLQLDKPEKGFSFMQEGPLDMRMNPEGTLDARFVVNSLSEKELGEIFRIYGEERRWRQAAKAIVQARKKQRIETTLQLCQVLESVLKRTGKIHPMTRVFQALRIYVNDELKTLENALFTALACLKTNGRLVVISFHSLEDRIVKHTFRHFLLEEKCVNILTKKPVVATREEVRQNPRSRSAKLRALEKR